LKGDGIVWSPTLEARSKRKPKQFKGLEADWRPPIEVANMISTASERDKAFIAFIYLTGCRVSEALSAVPEDIRDDEDYYTIYHKVLKKRETLRIEKHVGKRNKGDELLLRHLLGWSATTNPGEKLFPFTRRTGYTIIYKHLMERSHRLRHWYATRLRREKDMDLQEIQEYMGWKFIRDAARYSHIAKKSLKEKVI